MAIKLNIITITNAKLASPTDKFFDQFADCFFAYLINIFSGYNQVDLDVESRDFTKCMILIKWMKITLFS